MDGGGGGHEFPLTKRRPPISMQTALDQAGERGLADVTSDQSKRARARGKKKRLLGKMSVNYSVGKIRDPKSESPIQTRGEKPGEGEVRFRKRRLVSAKGKKAS